jgi:hypothetical protein
MSGMLAGLRLYLWDVISNWAGYSGAGILVLDVAMLLLRKRHIEAIDRWITEEWRIRIFRTLAVCLLFLAGFFAWHAQYDQAKKLPDLHSQVTILARAKERLSVENSGLRLENDLANKAKTEEHDKVELCKRQLQDYQSQIRAQLPLPPVVLRSTDPDYRTTIFVLMMILNKTAPSVSITNYQLLLDTAVGKFEFPAELMPDPNTSKPAERALLDALHSVQLSNIKLTSESLIEETRQPMKQGQRAIGFLMFKTQDDIYDKLINTKGSMTIVFVDSQDQRHEETLEYDRSVLEKSGLSCPVL